MDQADYSDSYSNGAIVPELVDDSAYQNQVYDNTEISVNDVVEPEIVEPINNNINDYSVSDNIDQIDEYANIVSEESSNINLVEVEEIPSISEEISSSYQNVESEDALEVNDAINEANQYPYEIVNDEQWSNIDKGETANRTVEILIVVVILALITAAALFVYKKFTSPAAPVEEEVDIEGQPLAEGEEAASQDEAKEGEVKEAEQEKVEQA